MQRQVHTDALETLGKIHYRVEKRDAIHIAVEPVEAGQKLKPGERVALSNGKAFAFIGDDTDESHGIVDPFLTGDVECGDKFWLLLLPRTVRSLRHVWSHPMFPEEQPAQPDPEDIATAKLVVHSLAGDLGTSDRDLMEGAAEYLDGGHYMHFGHDLNYGWDMARFWRAYSLLTGKYVPDDKAEDAFFSCSC